MCAVGGGEGGERGAEQCLGRRQAGHPGRRRCAPGGRRRQRGSGQAAARVGADCDAAVTRSCAPRSRGDIHRPAGPGSALAPRVAHGSAAAQGPRAAPRFAPSYFGSRRKTAGRGLRVDGGCALVASGVRPPPSPASAGRAPEISKEVLGAAGRRRRADQGGTPKPHTQPRRRRELAEPRRRGRGAVSPGNPQRKVWLLASCGGSPRRSGTAAAGDDTPGAGGAAGGFRACFSWPGVGAAE